MNIYVITKKIIFIILVILSESLFSQSLTFRDIIKILYQNQDTSMMKKLIIDEFNIMTYNEFRGNSSNYNNYLINETDQYEFVISLDVSNIFSHFYVIDKLENNFFKVNLDYSYVIGPLYYPDSTHFHRGTHRIRIIAGRNNWINYYKELQYSFTMDKILIHSSVPKDSSFTFFSHIVFQNAIFDFWNFNFLDIRPFARWLFTNEAYSVSLPSIKP